MSLGVYIINFLMIIFDQYFNTFSAEIMIEINADFMGVKIMTILTNNFV